MKNSVGLTNYDSIAHIYIPYISHEKSFNNLYERPGMLSLFEDFSYKNVLDVGCGTGYYSFYALKQNARVTAVDASQKMLEHIKNQDQAGQIQLFCHDITEGLPFIQSDSQDHIVCSLVLHYIEDWHKIITDFYRILKDKGQVYISTHHPMVDYLHLKKQNYFDRCLVGDIWGAKDQPFPVHYYTRSLSDLLKPLIESNFRIKKLEEPLPGEQCKQLDPGLYARLLKKPAFLFITLQKNN